MRCFARLCACLIFVASIAPSPTWAQTANTAKQPAAPATAAPAPALDGVEGDRNASYTDRIPADQIVTLEAGSDKFRGWHIADLTGQTRGAVIVLPDSGHLPSWPFTAAALIDDLPLHGWDTLNIELPVPAADTLTAETTVPTVPAATKNPAPAAGNSVAVAAAPAAATAATTTSTGIEQQTQARIGAAIKYFADQNQRNIVLIGFGSGAIRAATALPQIAKANTAAAPGDKTAAVTGPVSALVMIAPQQRLRGDMDLPKLLPLTGIPALDITLDSSTRTRGDAEARRRAVLHQRTRIYTQLELPPINNASDAQNSEMVKRVRSWLQVNAHPQQP